MLLQLQQSILNGVLGRCVDEGESSDVAHSERAHQQEQRCQRHSRHFWRAEWLHLAVLLLGIHTVANTRAYETSYKF